jgi:hypothetical protein
MNQLRPKRIFRFGAKGGFAKDEVMQDFIACRYLN